MNTTITKYCEKWNILKGTAAYNPQKCNNNNFGSKPFACVCTRVSSHEKRKCVGQHTNKMIFFCGSFPLCAATFSPQNKCSTIPIQKENKNQCTQYPVALCLFIHFSWVSRVEFLIRRNQTTTNLNKNLLAVRSRAPPVYLNIYLPIIHHAIVYATKERYILK